MATLFLLLPAPDLLPGSLFVFFLSFPCFLFSFVFLLFPPSLPVSISIIPALSCLLCPEIPLPRWRMESPGALMRSRAVSFFCWLIRLLFISDKAGSPVWYNWDKYTSGLYFSSVFHVPALLSVSGFLAVSDPAYAFLPIRSCFRNPRYFFFL